MTSKEYLQRAKNIDAEVKSLKEQKEILYAELTKCTVPTDIERVGGTKINSRELKLIKLGDLIEKIEKLEISLLVVKSEIIDIIESVPNDVCRTILFERYVNFKVWHQIARVVNYDEKYIIQRLHPRALKYIEKIINS